MAGYQFAHMATHSRKGNRPYTSVGEITAEAARLPGSCPHVADPKAPNLLFGVAPDTIPSILEQRIALAKGRSHGKAMPGIRHDTHVIQSIVCSHPAYVQAPPEGSQTASPSLGDPGTMRDYVHWRDLTVDFIRWDAERRGLTVLSLVEHLDEKHPHIHAYLAPNNARHDAKACHPGHMAKREVVAAGGGLKEQTRGYKAAMRAWQDEYRERVGEPCGLTRFGPHLKRLTREGWHHKQKDAELAKVARERAEAAVSEEAVALDALRAAAESTNCAVRVRNEAERQAVEAEAREQKAETALHELHEAVAVASLELRETADQLNEKQEALARMQAELDAAERRRLEVEEAAMASAALLEERRLLGIAQEKEASHRLARARAATNKLAHERELIDARVGEQRLEQEQHALLLRANVDETLHISADEESERGFTMNVGVMNEHEKRAYAARWSNALKALARMIVAAKIRLRERTRELLRSEEAVKAEKGELARMRAELVRNIVAQRGEGDRLAKRKNALSEREERMMPLLAEASAFERAHAAIPPEKRDPSVVEALKSASRLRQLAEGLGHDGLRTSVKASDEAFPPNPTSSRERD